MFTLRALGEMCYPMIIYNYKRIPQDIVNSVPTNWGYWSFWHWVDEVGSILWIHCKYIPPISHWKRYQTTSNTICWRSQESSDYQLSQLCSDLNIILIALYPNSTRILQPADVAGFRPLKASWKNGVSE